MNDTVELTEKHSGYDLSYPHYVRKSKNAKYPFALRCPRTLDNYLNKEFAETYVKIANYYGIDSLEFKSHQDFKICILFSKGIYGPYSAELGKELGFYALAPMQKLDSIFELKEQTSAYLAE